VRGIFCVPLEDAWFYGVFNNTMIRDTFLIADHPSSYTIKQQGVDSSQINVAGAQTISEGGVAAFFIQDEQLLTCYKFF
jgi:hypothetical protein